MGNIGWLKRALPFLATFAIGIFVASFFVNIGAPRFGNRSKCRHEVRELRIENEQLREENIRLRIGQSASEFEHVPDQFLNSQSIDEPVLPPPPPVRVHKDRSR
ncbi:MAG: hypothetical protein IPL32_02640 [Chloracidobacterium sp.]|nr:hypothetical protein [Chloracidobacterium sp.]